MPAGTVLPGSPIAPSAQPATCVRTPMKFPDNAKMVLCHLLVLLTALDARQELLALMELLLSVLQMRSPTKTVLLAL